MPLAGKPLIAWTIEAALQSPSLSSIIVSTDDAEIAEVSRQWGAKVPFMRPAELAGDTSPHIEVVLHAVRWLEIEENLRPDFVMLLQPTSPLRTSRDIEEAVNLVVQKKADSVVSVCLAHHHPYLAKRINEDGTLTDFIGSSIEYLRRQDLPTAYALNGAIYLTRREVLLREKSLSPAGTFPYVMAPERSMEIDTPWDYYFMNLIFEPELPISSCLDPSNAPSSTRAIVVSLTDAVNHPIKLTNPSLGVVS